jgi:transposase
VKLLWPGNSPDLNAIEPTWNWMKRKTTKKGCPTRKLQMKEDWLKCWKDMPQEKIQEWIERIYIHIQEVIKLDGGMSTKKEGAKVN